MSRRDTRTPTEIEQDKAVREVVAQVQFVYFLGTVPHYLFTFALLLALPAVFFHQAFSLSSGSVTASLAAWAVGVAGAVFAGRLVPPVAPDAIIDAMHDSDHPSAQQYKVMRGPRD